MLTVVIHSFPIVSEAIVLAARRSGMAAVGSSRVSDTLADLADASDFVVLAEVAKATGVSSWTSLDALRALPGWRGGIVSSTLRRPEHLAPFGCPSDDLIFAPWSHVAGVREILERMMRHQNGAGLTESWAELDLDRQIRRLRVNQETGEFIAGLCAGTDVLNNADAYIEADECLTGLASDIAQFHPLRHIGVPAAADLWWAGQLDW